ncbi:hypothetical protein sS8_0177 [Methylocaldum marinum]|uniref:Secretin/TonB short N-terminal domain-containing protein n=1 Tax=Methylocaldum marinum TaxID=1432792 RepID=A0A286P3C3_9GAMM|nr:TonB-dependent receptor [Methylocaldum marinum]BBA32145.1 hypothetical protein sS8_0177 [Methylocaldum marinum]
MPTQHEFQFGNHTAATGNRCMAPAEFEFSPKNPYRKTGSTLTITLLTATLALSAPVAGALAAEAPREYTIPAQSLNSALMAFAAASGVELIFTADTVRGLSSKGLSGRMTPEQALNRLLAGSGIDYRFVDGRTVTLERKASPVPASSGAGDAFALGKVTVSADAVYDPNDPYSKDYAVPNATTATKTDTPIMETPVSIQVVPRAVMDDQQAIRVEDAIKNVSGVIPGASDGNYMDAFIVRGFDIGNNTYRNGYRTQRQQSETANLQRLEILKGAAAMLYGRIQPGGLLNLVTKQPLETPYYAVQQQFGSYDLYRTTLDATGPVLDDKSLLYRFNIAYQNTNSFRDFISTERIFVAPSLTWNVTSDTQFNLNLEYKHDWGVDDYGVPAVGKRPAPIPISRRLGQPQENFENDLLLINFNASHAFNENWKLRLGVNANSNEFSQEDIPPRILEADNRTLQQGAWFMDISESSRGVNLDLVGNFQALGMDHSVLFGGDYYSYEQKSGGYANRYQPIGSAIDINNPVYGGVDFRRLRSLKRSSSDFFYTPEEEWFGLYFQDDITLFDKLHILGGGRYDWATTIAGFSNTSFDAVNKTATRNERFSPRVGILYQPWSWLSLYGNYVESLGSSNGLNISNKPFDPQTATQYEVGIKAEWNRIMASLAYYHLTKDNLLTTNLSTGVNEPLGEARSQGIELDVSGKITDQLHVIASYAFTDARVTKSNDLSGGTALEGRRLPHVPEHQASFWVKYSITDQFSIGSGVYLVSQREGDTTGSFQLPGYARWDAMAAYRFDIGKNRLTAQINVNNILDMEYYKSGQTWTRLRIPVGEPLMVLGSLRLEF